MDIGLIQPELVYPRGAEKQLCKLASNLRRKGHEVTIYTFEKSEPYAFDSLLEGCRIVSLGKPWSIDRRFLNYPRWLKMSRDLAGMIGDHDVLNGHNFPAPWASSFAEAPFVWMCNEPARPYIRFRRSQPGGATKAAHGIFRRADRYLCRRISLIACFTRAMRDFISGIYPGTSVEISWSGAELDREVKRSADDKVDVLFVGAMHPQKRPQDILDAASLIGSQLPLKLHMVGDGEQRAYLEKRARALGIEAEFYGSVSDDQLYSLYAMADISVYVPQDEPWGIFPLESILAGIPTILSDQCGSLEVLKDPTVVRTGDAQALARAILSLAKEPERYLDAASENKKTIEKEFTWDAYSDRMIGLFRKVVG